MNYEDGGGGGIYGEVPEQVCPPMASRPHRIFMHLPSQGDIMIGKGEELGLLMHTFFSWELLLLLFIFFLSVWRRMCE